MELIKEKIKKRVALREIKRSGMTYIQMIYENISRDCNIRSSIRYSARFMTYNSDDDDE